MINIPNRRIGFINEIGEEIEAALYTKRTMLKTCFSSNRLSHNTKTMLLCGFNFFSTNK